MSILYRRHIRYLKTLEWEDPELDKLDADVPKTRLQFEKIVEKLEKELELSSKQYLNPPRRIRRGA